METYDVIVNQPVVIDNVSENKCFGKIGADCLTIVYAECR